MNNEKEKELSDFENLKSNYKKNINKMSIKENVSISLPIYLHKKIYKTCIDENIKKSDLIIKILREYFERKEND